MPVTQASPAKKILSKATEAGARFLADVRVAPRSLVPWARTLSPVAGCHQDFRARAHRLAWFYHGRGALPSGRLVVLIPVSRIDCCFCHRAQGPFPSSV